MLIVGLAIIAALTDVVVSAGYVYDFVSLIEQLSSGNTDFLPTVEYRDDVINSSLPDTQTDSKNGENIYSVCKLVDTKKSGLDAKEKVEYIGRIKYIGATITRHNNNPYRNHLKLVVIKSNLTYLIARGLEQYYIEYYSTLNRNKDNPNNNQINGVNTNNEKKYK